MRRFAYGSCRPNPGITLRSVKPIPAPRVPALPRPEQVLAPVDAAFLKWPKPSTDRDEPSGARAPLGSSLASTDQTVTRVLTRTCPRSRGTIVLELNSGTAYPDRCRSSSCDVCLPLNARRRTLAITFAAPERMIRLSLVADAGDEHPCTTALIRIKRIRQALRRKDIDPGEWTFTLEKNPKETGFHVHCLQRGPYLPQSALQEACHSARAGFPDIRAIKRKGPWTSQYGLKGFGADGYGLKQFRPSGDPMYALRINNGRVEHHSRGFFAVNGHALRVRLFERRAIRALNRDKPLAFVNVRPDDVDKILNDEELRIALLSDINTRALTSTLVSPLVLRLKHMQNA